MNYSQTLEYIHSLKKINIEPGLKRISLLMGKLGDVQKQLKCVHVAGTNGKGSICSMIAASFEEEGLKTGLYTSPFIIDFRERIKINGKFIPKNDLIELSERVRGTGIEVNEFEFITAVAFLYFAKQQCDVVVLETGLGGAFDATNIIEKPLCSVIARIDLDHTAVLGDTAEEICREKMGIAKSGCPLVAMSEQPDSICDLIKSIKPDSVFTDSDSISVISSDITGSSFIYKGREYRISLVGEFQIFNAVTALETLRICGATYNSIYKGLEKAFIPARAEIVSRDPLTVLDGAHNPNGADALAKLIKRQNGPNTAIVGMMSDKNCLEVMQRLMPLFDNVCTVAVKNNPRSLTTQQTAQMALRFCSNVTACESYEQAIAEARKTNNAVFIFGSLYLASDIRKFFLNDEK